MIRDTSPGEQQGLDPRKWDTTYVDLSILKEEAGGNPRSQTRHTLNHNVVQGYTYEQGQPGPSDHRKALECYARAVEEGSVLGAFLLGRISLAGASEVRDQSRGLHYLQIAAQQGNTDAMEMLAWFCLKSRNPSESREAVSWYTRAAKKGHVRAQYNLGYIYYRGLGVRKDYKLALHWYRKAAEQDDRHAQYGLAMVLLSRKKKPAHLSHALAWLRLAAEAGYARAQYQVGLMYAGGIGVPRNDTTAVYWYRLAAAQHYAHASYSLALCHETGLGVPCDTARAFRHLLQAAELGYNRAQYQLARLYQSRALPNSSEEKKCRALAFEWAEKAARQRYIKAQRLLGFFYAEGYGTIQDLERAYGWLYLAGLSGDSKAQRAIGKIASLLPEEEIEEAFEWAMQWHHGQDHRFKGSSDPKTTTDPGNESAIFKNFREMPTT